MEDTTATKHPAGTRPPLVGIAATAAAAAAWGMAAVFIKLATLPALSLTFYRLAVASVLLLVASLASGRRRVWHALPRAVPAGLLLCGDMCCFFSAVKFTSIADVTVIGALQPALVMFAAGPLFGEHIGRRDVAWTALAIAGVVAVVIGGGVGSTHDLAGDLLATASLGFWSVYFLVSKGARRHLGALEYTLGVTVVAMIATVPIVFIAHQSLGGIGAISERNWLWIALLALVPGGGHLLINWAHRIVDVSVSSVVGASNPIFAVVAAWLVLHQSLVVLQIAGGAVGIIAICAIAGTRRLPASSGLEPVANETYG
ncbi:MAG: DMT family transporter [Actinomycetota bacterium]|nr:DMT family transporter [Actinomycetota bacterium]